jgi:hypothetical protein
VPRLSLSFDLAAFLPACLHLHLSVTMVHPSYLSCLLLSCLSMVILIVCLSIISPMLSVCHPACLSIDLAVFLLVCHLPLSLCYNSLSDSTCVVCLPSWCLSINLSISLSVATPGSRWIYAGYFCQQMSSFRILLPAGGLMQYAPVS